MKIKQLINELQKVEEEHGNLEVKPLENVQSASIELETIEVEDTEGDGLVWFSG